MDLAEINPGVATALVVAFFSLVGTIVSAIYTFRGGLTAAADDLGTGYSALAKDLRLEMTRLTEKYEKEIAELRKKYDEDMEAMRIRIGALEKRNEYLIGEFNRETYRSQYYRNGAWKLYNQYNDLKRYGKVTDEPLFNPAIDKFAPEDKSRGVRPDDTG